MKTIHKQIIASVSGGLEPEYRVKLPKNSAILSISEQHDSVVVHYLCDTEEKESFTFKFFLFETGKELPKFIGDLSYLKTLSFSLFECHIYVVHVFVDLRALEDGIATEQDS